uniref:Secreted protein n=1 Tax=Arundo donax TaxID=35708 RepID=A0A0A9B225_ARUDO
MTEMAPVVCCLRIVVVVRLLRGARWRAGLVLLCSVRLRPSSGSLSSPSTPAGAVTWFAAAGIRFLCRLRSLPLATAWPEGKERR